MKTDPYQIGEALAAQVIRLADHEKDRLPNDPASAALIRNIVISAQRALASGKECLAEMDIKSALYAMGIADGAMTLITGLLENSDDPFFLEMATPFAVGLDSEVQQ